MTHTLWRCPECHMIVATHPDNSATRRCWSALCNGWVGEFDLVSAPPRPTEPAYHTTNCAEAEMVRRIREVLDTPPHYTINGMPYVAVDELRAILEERPDAR